MWIIFIIVLLLSKICIFVTNSTSSCQLNVTKLMMEVDVTEESVEIQSGWPWTVQCKPNSKSPHDGSPAVCWWLQVDGRWFEVDTDARHSLIVAKGDRLKILTASPEMNGHRLLCGSADGRHYWRKMQIAVLLCNGTTDPCNGRGRCVWSRMAPHTLPIVSCVCEKNYYGTFCTEYIGNAVFHGWATVVAAFLLLLLSTVLYSLKRSKIDKMLHQQRQKQKRLRAKATRREMKYPVKTRPISRPQPITLRQPSKPKSKNLHRRRKHR